MGAGHYDFPGMDDDWQHKHECLRLTFTQDQQTVEKGLSILAEEVLRLYSQA